MLIIALAMSYRATRRDTDIGSEQMRQVWIAIIGLIGTIVGFLLGSASSGL